MIFNWIKKIDLKYYKQIKVLNCININNKNAMKKIIVELYWKKLFIIGLKSWYWISYKWLEKMLFNCFIKMLFKSLVMKYNWIILIEIKWNWFFFKWYKNISILNSIQNINVKIL